MWVWGCHYCIWSEVASGRYLLSGTEQQPQSGKVSYCWKSSPSQGGMLWGSIIATLSFGSLIINWFPSLANYDRTQRQWWTCGCCVKYVMEIMEWSLNVTVRIKWPWLFIVNKDPFLLFSADQENLDVSVETRCLCIPEFINAYQRLSLWLERCGD